MAIAHLDAYRSASTATAAQTATQTSTLTAVPTETEARGFALYVGIDEATATANGIDLAHLVEALKALTTQLAPTAETYAAVALAPETAGGRDVDVVRLALQVCRIGGH